MVSTTQDIGRATEQASFNTDAITGSGTVVNRVGKYAQSPGKFPQIDHTFYDNLFGGNAYSSILVRVKIQATLGYVVVDGMGLYYAIGNVANASLGGGLYSHTLTRRADGTSLPSYTTRTVDTDSGGSRNDREHYTGTITQSLLHQFDDSNRDGMLVATEVMLGIKNVTPAFQPTISYPNSDNDHYKRDGSMVFNYDQGGGNQTDYAADLVAFTVQFDNVIREDIDNSSPSLFLNGFMEGTRTICTGNITILRDDDNQIWSDYITDRGNDTQTKRDFRFKIYKNANEYIQYDLVNCSVLITRNYAILENNETPVWDVTYRADSFTITVVDQLNTADYFGVA